MGTGHIIGGYSVYLETTGRIEQWCKPQVRYTMGNAKNGELFSGSDYYPSPMQEPESRKSALELLSFLTLQDGDVDDEYFLRFGDRQRMWMNSPEAEWLGDEARCEEEDDGDDEE